MNPRISQLVNEAIDFATTDRVHNPTFNLNTFSEKFAQLIVRECIGTVLDSSVEYATRPQIADELREHFGVE